MDSDTENGGGSGRDASPDHHISTNSNSINKLRAYRYKNQKPLDALDVACLIINKMIGGGVFVSPSNIAFLTGNKLVALSLWIFGGMYSFCSMYIYLEYGLAWPYNGGELIYMAKIFPIPPLLFASCFAWFFILFATTTNNAITFAKYINPHEAEKPDEWFVKFLACVIVLAVSGLHYRLVNIGILANNVLAAYKVFFLGSLTVAGLFATCRDGTRDNRLRGLGDYTKTYGNVSGTNIALAVLHVLYSYHGWENANYVTSEIQGPPEERKKTLKKGALIAISVVNILYILFNLFVFFVLDYHTIIDASTPMPGNYAVKVFQSEHASRTTKHAIYICIALSAVGNLTGVIFTNARVARDIAKYRLILFYKFFSMSSGYGTAKWDRIGTPTGGLVLHATVTCIYIASIPLCKDGDSNQSSQQYVLRLYTYGHSVVTFILGIGILFLKRRMKQYETSKVDPPDQHNSAKWSYQVLRSAWTRYGTVTFLAVVNLFLIALPFKSTTNSNETSRDIPSWVVPITVFSAFALGALVALYIICFVRKLEFKQRSLGDGFVSYNNRKWIIGWPDLGEKDNWSHVYQPLPWKQIWGRLFDNAEARSAAQLRDEIAIHTNGRE